tara:strand:- start:141223 stop:142086 length:864 start_codon:yes stop_codon:yes gene_type:complete
MPKPLVSVRLMVYNNEPYIKETIEGILMQKTDFLVEVVVGDDFSEDRTPSIIKEYKNTDNIYFNILQREVGGEYWTERKKLGRLYNFINIVDNCEGKYIALLDGDDYWTDSLKLQKQVDFMEANTNYNYCGHKSSRSFKGAITKMPLEIAEFSFKELVFKNCLNSATLFFRKSAIQNIPDYFTSISTGDWALQLIAIRNSKAFVLEDYMSVYREHEQGLWSSMGNEEKCMRGVKMLETFKEFYPDKHSHKLIKSAILERKKTFGLIKKSFLNKLLFKIKSKLKKTFS